MTPITPAMRRSALISLLRNPQDWPEGFQWDYQFCDTCAVGLLRRLMPSLERDGGEHTDQFMGRVLGLPVWDAHKTFLSEFISYHVDAWDVTPTMVADRLEQLHRELGE